MLNTIEQAEGRAAAMRASWAGDTVLTPLGGAMVAARRLASLLGDLDPEDRFAVLNVVLAESARLRTLDDPAPIGA